MCTPSAALEAGAPVVAAPAVTSEAAPPAAAAPAPVADSAAGEGAAGGAKSSLDPAALARMQRLGIPIGDDKAAQRRERFGVPATAGGAAKAAPVLDVRTGRRSALPRTRWP